MTTNSAPALSPPTLFLVLALVAGSTAAVPLATASSPARSPQVVTDQPPLVVPRAAPRAPRVRPEELDVVRRTAAVLRRGVPDRAYDPR